MRISSGVQQALKGVWGLCDRGQRYISEDCIEAGMVGGLKEEECCVCLGVLLNWRVDKVRVRKLRMACLGFLNCPY